MSDQSNSRTFSIDIARGLIMVIMALDHVRDFIHKDALVFDPTNLERATPAIFFTRWITHFCAPAFMLLAGMSIYLSLQRRTRKEQSFFLVKRGLWLMFLDVVVMRFGFFFNFYYDATFLSILWTIGVCMILMAAIIHLRERTIFAAAVIIIFLHNALDFVQIAPGDPFYVPWLILMRIGVIPMSHGAILITSYSIPGWLGIMMLGFAFGHHYLPEVEPRRRQRILFLYGLCMVLLFIVMRHVNIYGDPSPWVLWERPLYTFMSFLNTTKYPVSFLFSMMTIGPIFILLAALEYSHSKFWKPFQVFGRVPLFYFILHFYLAHAIALFLYMRATGKTFGEIDLHFAASFGGITAEGGRSLIWVYGIWILLVMALYPLCLWYDRYKSAHNHKWLSYL
jgi:uncharacterized membrane protein